MILRKTLLVALMSALAQAPAARDIMQAVERVIKTPLSMMLKSWMGSDFSNDDLVKEISVLGFYRRTLHGSAGRDGQSVFRTDIRESL